jgi:nicotinamidase-related amidase
MADAYEKLEEFQNAFRQYAMPVVATEDEFCGNGNLSGRYG